MNFFRGGGCLGGALGGVLGLLRWPSAPGRGPWFWAPHADPMQADCPTELRHPSGWTPHDAGIPHKRQDSSQPRSTPQHHTANPPAVFYFFWASFLLAACCCCTQRLSPPDSEHATTTTTTITASTHHHHHNHGLVPLIHKVPKIASTSPPCPCRLPSTMPTHPPTPPSPPPSDVSCCCNATLGRCSGSQRGKAHTHLPGTSFTPRPRRGTVPAPAHPPPPS